jgi:hypothetical protein
MKTLVQDNVFLRVVPQRDSASDCDFQRGKAQHFYSGTIVLWMRCRMKELIQNDVFLTVVRLLPVCGATACGTTVVRVEEPLTCV